MNPLQNSSNEREGIGIRMTKKDEAFKVVWPIIEVFPSMLTNEVELKEQAKKVLEEAAEIYAAIDDVWDEAEINWDQADKIIEECTDCVTAISNLIARTYMGWARVRLGRFGWMTINSLCMNEHVGRVYGKNWRRGYYKKTDPDIGDGVDRDGDVENIKWTRRIKKVIDDVEDEQGEGQAW